MMPPALSHAAILGCVKRLPALPRIVHELDRALRIEPPSSARVIELIASDPGLTAEALRLANSSFYGVSGRVVTLRDALQILGLQTLSAAVTTAAVLACFEPAACPGFDFTSNWQNALTTALYCESLGVARGVDAGLAYTAGLLHDIGTLALATYFPEPFSATLALSARRGIGPLEAERELLGTDHAAVGGLIARHWQLSPAIVEAIEGHHEETGGHRSALLEVLVQAHTAIHALELGPAH
ncbi:MAG TPA: HDOD domain-containing protein [Burkholderiaceae bacterium]|jgi:putative nucleotidyltransferase with HDIG domain